MQSRYLNSSTLLTAAALQVAVVWQDPATPWAVKLTCTLVACLGLALTREKLAEVEQLVVAACLVAGTVLTVVLGHLSGSSATAQVVSVALAVATQVIGLVSTQLKKNASTNSREGGPDGTERQ